jgi:hypothetical protein
VIVFLLSHYSAIALLSRSLFKSVKKRIKTGDNAKEDVRFLKAVTEKTNPKNEIEFLACLSSFDNETKLKALLSVASIPFMNVSNLNG